MDAILTYRGINIEDLTKPELIEALRVSHRETQAAHEDFDRVSKLVSMRRAR